MAAEFYARDLKQLACSTEPPLRAIKDEECVNDVRFVPPLLGIQ